MKFMKDRIGQSSRKKKPVDKSVSSITGVPTPDSFAGFSADDDYQPKKPKWPILVYGVVAVALVAGGAWYFLSNQGSITEPGTPSVQYPENTAGVDEQQQAMQDVLQSAKEQRVPSMTQLVDLIAINKLAGTLESEGDGKNANVVATLPTESLAQKATEFKESTNEDTIGWIQLPNTNVDYPVVYKAGSENYDYYGSLDYNKNYSKDGAIFADYECSFPELSQNTTLYGHNWHNVYTPRTLENMQSNDTMFSLVMSYHYTDFAQENPFIYFSTTEKDYVFQVFAAYYTDISKGKASMYNFANTDQETFQEVIAEAKAKSMQNYNVPVTSEDHILTLSTCTRMKGASDTQRFVVMAKLVSEGTPSTTISTHTNPMTYNVKLTRPEE